MEFYQETETRNDNEMCHGTPADVTQANYLKIHRTFTIKTAHAAEPWTCKYCAKTQRALVESS